VVHDTCRVPEVRLRATPRATLRTFARSLTACTLHLWMPVIPKLLVPDSVHSFFHGHKKLSSRWAAVWLCCPGSLWDVDEGDRVADFPRARRAASRRCGNKVCFLSDPCFINSETSAPCSSEYEDCGTYFKNALVGFDSLQELSYGGAPLDVYSLFEIVHW